MEYRDCVINLLDTPGHQDFSEDTYRVLTAVDAALMVIDAANGVEPQTRRLLEVCRARNTPILTFVNKMDREVREPLDADGRDRARARHGVVPFTWPVGMGKTLSRRDGPARASACACSRPARTAPIDATTRSSTGSTNPALRRALRRRVRARAPRHRAGARRRAGVRRARVPRRPPDADVLRLGDQQLRRARSARRAGRPGAAAGPDSCDAAHRASPTSPSSPAWCSRSRPTWTRRTATASRSCASCSGHFERGMKLKVSAHRQGAAAQHGGDLPVAAPRAARRGLRRRHHRHPEPRRAAAGRHARPRARRCSSPGCRSSRRRCSAASRWPTRCAPSS